VYALSRTAAVRRQNVVFRAERDSADVFSTYTAAHVSQHLKQHKVLAPSQQKVKSNGVQVMFWLQCS
jgi:hypothetical protein